MKILWAIVYDIFMEIALRIKRLRELKLTELWFQNYNLITQFQEIHTSLTWEKHIGDNAQQCNEEGQINAYCSHQENSINQKIFASADSKPSKTPETVSKSANQRLYLIYWACSEWKRRQLRIPNLHFIVESIRHETFRQPYFCWTIFKTDKLYFNKIACHIRMTQFTCSLLTVEKS